MELGIGFGNALQDLGGLLNGGLRHGHRLEAALQGRVFFNILPVLIEGGGTDDLDFPPGQRGLEDIGGIHAALGITGAHQVVDLINDQNDIAAGLDLGDQALHAAFKLAPELGSGNQCREIQQKYLFVPELVGYLSRHDSLGQALGNGGLAHAGLAYQAGVVLLTAVQNLDDPFRLHIPANDLVQRPGPGPGCQIHAIAVQELVLGLFLFFMLFFGVLGFFRLLLHFGQIAKELVH